MSKMWNLKRCPFCWDTDAELAQGRQGDKVKHYVECTNCSAQAGWEDTEEEAVKMWNRRGEDGEYL